MSKLMGLIGLGGVTIVAIGAAVRSKRTLNKCLVLLFWTGYTAFSLGWSV